jgi:NodT family efflux transporter outer membrane factor (OMF) lipoprotein
MSASGCRSLENWLQNGGKVGPEYCCPAVRVAETWIENGDARLSEDSPELAAWWTVFHDPVLDELVQEAYHQNLSLSQAASRILAARHQYAITAGRLFPQQQQAFAHYGRIAESVNVANSFIYRERFHDEWGSGFNLAWELDFWGKIRRQMESASAELDASVEDYHAVLVSLLGDVAETYVNIRSCEKRLELVHKNIELQEDLLRLAESRFRLGATSELDRQQAQSRVSATKAQVPDLTIRHRQSLNRLCTLLGQPTHQLHQRLGETGVIPTPPSAIAIGVPADLLRRRPDVRKAERDVAAQMAQIGVAEADLYPRLSLNGTISVRSKNLSDLFSSPSQQGFVGPAADWPILNYGRIVNNVRLQDDRTQALAARYQEAVLRAHQEAEDAIISYLLSHERAAELDEGRQAVSRSVQLARKQYQEGAATFDRFDLLASRHVEYDEKWVQAQAEIVLSLIRVYKALGGGWEFGDSPQAE